VARRVIVEAPSILGLHPEGVERLPDALAAAGLAAGLGAEEGARVEPTPYDPRRDPETRLLNPAGIAAYARRLADAVEPLLRASAFPVVLGGDCSILIGAALALKRLGRYGLVFLDGHADFYQPEASPTGEAADMELGIVTGRGPAVVADLEGRGPYLRDEDVVVFGFRDGEEAAAAGSRDVRESAMHVFPLDRVRDLGATSAAALGLRRLLDDDRMAGFWLHLDADVLDDAVMPAVDYRLPGGLSPAELGEVLRVLLASGRAVGMEITIYNPRLDPDGAVGRTLVSAVLDGFAGSG
jgi:arginase